MDRTKFSEFQEWLDSFPEDPTSIDKIANALTPEFIEEMPDNLDWYDFDLPENLIALLEESGKVCIDPDEMFAKRSDFWDKFDYKPLISYFEIVHYGEKGRTHFPCPGKPTILILETPYFNLIGRVKKGSEKLGIPHLHVEIDNSKILQNIEIVFQMGPNEDKILSLVDLLHCELPRREWHTPKDFYDMSNFIRRRAEHIIDLPKLLGISFIWCNVRLVDPPGILVLPNNCVSLTTGTQCELKPDAVFSSPDGNINQYTLREYVGGDIGDHSLENQVPKTLERITIACSIYVHHEIFNLHRLKSLGLYNAEGSGTMILETFLGVNLPNLEYLEFPETSGSEILIPFSKDGSDRWNSKYVCEKPLQIPKTFPLEIAKSKVFWYYKPTFWQTNFSLASTFPDAPGKLFFVITPEYSIVGESGELVTEFIELSEYNTGFVEIPELQYLNLSWCSIKFHERNYMKRVPSVTCFIGTGGGWLQTPERLVGY